MKGSHLHRRLPEVQEVDIATVQADPTFVSAPGLVNTYVALARGKVKVSVTRIATAAIYPGFFRREADGAVTHVKNFKPCRAAGHTDEIRNGLRPVLDLQWTPHAPNGGGYVCADDEYSLAAYQRLKISFVPCRILRPKASPATEAALWIEKEDKAPIISRAVEPKVTTVPSYFGERTVELPEAISLLKERCEETLLRVKLFHADFGLSVHYHEMLHAVVRRHARALDSIGSLTSQGKREHGLAICRLAYEGFLNFYLDWLSPQLIGPRLQLLAELRSSEKVADRGKHSAWKVLTNFPGLLENTRRKAELSPLGTAFHDAIYPPLSLIAHQSYGGVELEAKSFDRDIEQSQINFSDRRLVMCLDMLTAALLTRVDNDVGGADETTP